MSISFVKHREKLIAAWKDVLDDKSTTNWALFGYEGQTNELKLVASGEGGLEELGEDLNTGKVMYAFVRISDDKSNLTKYLLINWQGEGAPVLRKGTCANHIHDIAKFLPGVNLTINARTEDDIDEERILKKLSAVTGCSKEPRVIQEEQKGSIGTNYTRVIPAKELNPKEMQTFWKKEEEEERSRIEIEKERKRHELLKQEKEQRSREEKEHMEREKVIINKEKLQPAHIPIKTSPQPLSPEKNLSSPTRAVTDAERMRQQRNKEAKELIGSRVGLAKAIFAQNTSESQLESKISSAPVKPVRNSIAQRINALNNPQQENEDLKTSPKKLSATAKEQLIAPEVTANSRDDVQHHTDDLSENEEQYSTIKRSPHNKTNSIPSPDDDSQVVANISQTQTSNGNSNKKSGDIFPPEEDMIYQDVLSENGLKARALYDYQAADESEITFDPDDIITHIDQIDEGWWQGLGPDGTYGLFPANYVELIN